MHSDVDVWMWVGMATMIAAWILVAWIVLRILAGPADRPVRGRRRSRRG